MCCSFEDGDGGGQRVGLVRAIGEHVNLGSGLHSEGEHCDDAAQARRLLSVLNEDAAAETAGHLVQAMRDLGVDALPDSHDHSFGDHGAWIEMTLPTRSFGGVPVST